MGKKIDLVVLAGGRGSRIKKISKNLPKPLIKFAGKPFLHHLINNLCKFNFNKIYIIAGYKGQQIKKIFNNKKINLININCIIEKKPMDTGGALNLIKNKVKNDFILANGDTFFDVNINELINFKLKDSLGLIALVKNKNYKKNKKLFSLSINKKQNIMFAKRASLMNGGIYFFKKKFLNTVKNKKISLEDQILPNLIKKSQLKGKIFNNFFIDIGTPKNYFRAKRLLLKYIKRPAVFLDRDGTINYDLGYTHKFSKFNVVNSY